jgi:hypothetical protein
VRRLILFSVLLCLLLIPAFVTAQDAQANPVQTLLVNARTDLDALATQALGVDRPGGWTGNVDFTSDSIIIDVRLDLELLAGTLLGPDTRPVGWFGAIPSTTGGIVRDIRHDLELLADEINEVNIRPPGWIGADPLIRCDRAIQTLVSILEREAGYRLEVDPLASNFCTLVELQASVFAETGILNPRAQQAAAQSAAQAGQIQVTSPFAVGFFDRFGRERAGLIPVGQVLDPIARSYTQFSKMVLVRGDGFVVFMDYTASNLTEAQFVGLPDVNGVGAEPACGAVWCGT